MLYFYGILYVCVCDYMKCDNTGVIRNYIDCWKKEMTFPDADPTRVASLADSVAPKVSPLSVSPCFFLLGCGNKEVDPLLKKTQSRQYRVGLTECLRKHRNVFGILRRIQHVAAFARVIPINREKDWRIGIILRIFKFVVNPWFHFRMKYVISYCNIELFSL